MYSEMRRTRGWVHDSARYSRKERTTKTASPHRTDLRLTSCRPTVITVCSTTDSPSIIRTQRPPQPIRFSSRYKLVVARSSCLKQRQSPITPKPARQHIDVVAIVVNSRRSEKRDMQGNALYTFQPTIGQSRSWNFENNRTNLTPLQMFSVSPFLLPSCPFRALSFFRCFVLSVWVH